MIENFPNLMLGIELQIQGTQSTPRRINLYLGIYPNGRKDIEKRFKNLEGSKWENKTKKTYLMKNQEPYQNCF